MESKGGEALGAATMRLAKLNKIAPVLASCEAAILSNVGRIRIPQAESPLIPLPHVQLDRRDFVRRLLVTLTPQLHVTRPKSRILVLSVRNKKPGSKSRALRKNLKENRSSEHFSWEQLSRKRTRLFSYLDLSGSKDFALWECVKFS